MDGTSGSAGSHLMLFRTPKSMREDGLPVMAAGQGVRVVDQDGKSYLDLEAGLTRPVHIGYGRREMAQAVYDQICTLSYFTPVQWATRPALDLADVLAGLTPGQISRFLFVCDGSEAVEAALKLARHYHAGRGQATRYKVLSRRGAYHGTTGGALGALGLVVPMRHIMEPVAPGAIFVESPYCYRCPLHLTYPACDLACARDVERIIEFEGPEQISAFIGEPIQQGFGAYAPPAEYWPIIRTLCAKYGILLIVDEVICGFGRTGRWFGADHFGIPPDLITMAKGLTSGYVPLGGVGVTDAVQASIDVFQHIHTYGNHPVSCAAALKNLEIIAREQLVEHARTMGQFFLERLHALERHAIVGEVRGTGLWLAIDLTTDRETRPLFPVEHLARLVARARSKGLIIRPAGSAIELAPPLVIQPAEIEEGVQILDDCIAEEARA
jgi:adenosylmethionine-8-amino-7-oxononanoate aminotransferase